MSNLGYKQVANVTRRTWDVETYEKRAQERTKAAESGSARNHDKKSGNTPSAAVEVGEGTKPEFVPAEKNAAGPHKSERAFLKARQGRVDVDSKIGSVEMINPDAAATTSSVDPTSSSAATAGGSGSIKVCCLCSYRCLDATILELPFFNRKSSFFIA